MCVDKTAGLHLHARGHPAKTNLRRAIGSDPSYPRSANQIGVAFMLSCFHAFTLFSLEAPRRGMLEDWEASAPETPGCST